MRQTDRHACDIFHCFPAQLGSSEAQQHTQPLGVPFWAGSAVQSARRTARGVEEIPFQILSGQDYKLVTRAGYKHRLVTTDVSCLDRQVSIVSLFLLAFTDQSTDLLCRCFPHG